MTVRASRRGAGSDRRTHHHRGPRHPRPPTRARPARRGPAAHRRHGLTRRRRRVGRADRSHASANRRGGRRSRRRQLAHGHLHELLQSVRPVRRRGSHRHGRPGAVRDHRARARSTTPSTSMSPCSHRDSKRRWMFGRSALATPFELVVFGAHLRGGPPGPSAHRPRRPPGRRGHDVTALPDVGVADRSGQARHHPLAAGAV